MIWTSLFNRKGAKNDKELAISGQKVARSDKYIPYRIRTSLTKSERCPKWYGTRLIKTERGQERYVHVLSNRTAIDDEDKPYQTRGKPEMRGNKPYQDGKWPGAKSTCVIVLDCTRWLWQASSNQKEAWNDRKLALSRRKEPRSD